MSDATGPNHSADDDSPNVSISPNDIKTREDLHHAINKLYAASGLSNDTLAERTVLPPSVVRRIIAGRALPDVSIMFALIRATRPLPLSVSEMQAWTGVIVRLEHEQVRLPPSGTAAAEQAARRDLSEAESELIATEELTLPTLWRVTHARLDYYHQIATGQARQSFRNAQIAMGVGFALLVIFAILALYAQSTAGAVVAGALGATSAAFAAYIGRTFVRSQETAATHLRSYFDQPLEFSRYLAAERLLNSIERLEGEQRATITAEVLRGMLPAQNANGADKSAGGSDST